MPVVIIALVIALAISVGINLVGAEKGGREVSGNQCLLNAIEGLGWIVWLLVVFL